MHTFTTTEEKFALLYCWIYVHSCQCDASMWESEEYGIQRTNALRYLEYHMEKTDWSKAYPAIVMYAPKVVEFARRDCREFVDKYAAQDEEYLRKPQTFAVLKMLDKMKKTVDGPKTNPLLEKPKKPITKKKR